MRIYGICRDIRAAHPQDSRCTVHLIGRAGFQCRAVHLTIGHMKRTNLRYIGCFGLAAMAITAASAEEPQPDEAALPATIVPADYLLLPAVGQYGRLPLHRDAVESQLVAHTWKVPSQDHAVETSDGRHETWRAAKSDDAGALDTQKHRGGYALATFHSPAERIMLLEAVGHAMVYINGVPRAGDPYSLGWLRLPVRVREGQNTLLFHLAADKLRARLIVPPTGLFFSDEDRTFPTLISSETEPVLAAAPLINPTADWLEGATVECQLDDGQPLASPLAPIPPLSVRKVAFQVPAAGDNANPERRVKIRLIRDGDPGVPGNQSATEPKVLAEFQAVLKRVGPDDIHIRTFRSRIDGSVQSYAVRPAAKAVSESNAKSPNGERAPGMIVTLHGAAVSCEDHAARYAAKSWAHILAPQGRRTHGFDWEAWARDDAFEALADAREHYPNDPRRTYLTGHSMGGHGAWHLGVSRPHEFAAVGPSAGWISFWSYGGGMPSAETPSDIDALLLRGYSASDTLKLLSNLSSTGVYVLHGAADQNVPVAQARFMRARLASFHPNFAYFEEPAADHWWGNECCDWPRMMEFLQHQSSSAPAEQKFVDFTTANPAVSHSCYWVSIDAQQEQLSPSHVAIRQNADARTFVGTTANVARLAIDVAHLSPGQPIDVTLDGQELHWLPWPNESRKLWFGREGDEWSAIEAPSPQLKGWERYGTFNAAFDHNALLVYGTGGTEEENDWAAEKARFDAETFYYRGGGALEVQPDTRFDINSDSDRSVVLYGNADTNRAWSLLLESSPVEVRRGSVRVDTRTESGGDLAVLTVRPRPGSDTAMVGLVAGTGPAGMRLTNRLRWFISGIVYPDLMVLEPKVLTGGTAGVRAWGYFGLDWQAGSGEIAWRDAAL